MNSTKNIVILGKGKLAIDIIEYLRKKGCTIAFVVPVMPEPDWTDSLVDYVVEHNIPYVQSGNYRELSAKLEIDLAISIFYDKILKKDFIDRCKSAINIHNSPLPKYRGVSPINWALVNKEVEHGVTIHKITPEIDDGDIIAQIKYSIYPDIEEVVDVYNKALDYAFVLFTKTFDSLDKIIAIPQDHSKASYYNSAANVYLGNRRNFTRETSKEITNEQFQEIRTLLYEGFSISTISTKMNLELDTLKSMVSGMFREGK